MKILVVGAAGTIGKAVAAELEQRHTIVAASRSRGDYRVDIRNVESVRELFVKVGKIDAIVSAAGHVHWGPLATMTIDQFKVGLHDKLLGQVQLALLGRDYLTDGGSITLTTGVLSEDPVFGGTNASTANGALEGFVRSAAIELPRGIRINAVSPSVIVESLAEHGASFRGFEAVTAARAALAYSKSVEGAQTGQIYKVW
jgi:NAD(P)-dependent dehydrogenase (short-subunit alcohol dehydrogenase family)